MFRVSNIVIAILNSITFAISLAAIGYSLWIWVHEESLCQKVIQKPILITGLFLLAVSMMGLFGACCRIQFLLYLYLAVMFVLIAALFCFTIFTLLVTHKGFGNVVSGKGYKEYKLGDYSHWLQKYVMDTKNWDRIKSCLVDANVCGGVFYNNAKAADFIKKELPLLQSSCCKPPVNCGYILKNATYWEVPKKGVLGKDSDCSTWSNDGKEVCYDCNSCKAGVLSNIQKQWKVLAIVNLCVIVIIVFVYTLGCCALRNNRSDSYSYGKGFA